MHLLATQNNTIQDRRYASSSKLQYKVVRMNKIMLEVNAARILRHADLVHDYGRNVGTVRLKNANTISLGTSEESVVLFASEENC